MSIVARLMVVLGLVVTLGGWTPATAHASAIQDGALPDIADVPVPVSALPEASYQVLTGGYLDLETTAAWVADPRAMSHGRVEEDLSESGWISSYVLDAVLLEDRAYAESDILALIQTNVLLFADAEGAEQLYEVMSDYRGQSDTETLESAVDDSVTVALQSQSGETVRTVAVRDRVIVEVVTLESFRPVDRQAHDATVMATLDRLSEVRARNDVGLAQRATRLVDGVHLADLQNFQGSGVHHLYRLRNAAPQPAAGELISQESDAYAPGIVDLYLASEALVLDGGTGFLSTWIGSFETESAAAAFLTDITAGDPSDELLDPYFPIALEEDATSQAIEGVFRVTGVYEGQPYSGTLEVRQHGSYVVAITFRTLENALPGTDVTSQVMDHQLGCLEQDAACPLVDVTEFLAPPMATPVVPANSSSVLVSSEEFGWFLHADLGEWTVTERYAEAGYDFAEVQSGQSLVTFESVTNHHGDPPQCVIDELEMLQELESGARIVLGSGLDEHLAGSEPRHAWAIYTVEPIADERADQEYVIRIDCYTLIEGGASLVMTHRAPMGVWAEERVRGDVLRGGIVLPGMSRPPSPVALAPVGWERRDHRVA